MTSLYNELKGDRDAADAIRTAKLMMIKRELPPFFWAPFILIGN